MLAAIVLLVLLFVSVFMCTGWKRPTYSMQQLSVEMKSWSTCWWKTMLWNLVFPITAIILWKKNNMAHSLLAVLAMYNDSFVLVFLEKHSTKIITSN